MAKQRKECIYKHEIHDRLKKFQTQTHIQVQLVENGMRLKNVMILQNESS